MAEAGEQEWFGRSRPIRRLQHGLEHGSVLKASKPAQWSLVKCSAAGLSLVVCWVLLRPAVTIWSLDLEALVYNLYLDWTTDQPQRWYARMRWIPGLQTALAIGTYGFGGLVTYVLALRSVAFLLGVVRPELSSSAVPRRIFLALGSVSLALAAFPLSLALSMSNVIEIYPWLEWYRAIDPLMEDMLDTGLWLILPSLCAVGTCLLLNLAEPKGGEQNEPTTRSPVNRTLIALAMLLLALPTLFTTPAAIAHVSRAAPHLDGLATFAGECSSCHERALPLYFIKSPGEWTETVATHRRVEGVSLSEADATSLNDFLKGMRSFDDAWTFRTRCQSCHGGTWTEWDDRSAEDWERIVQRLSRWSPYYYNESSRHQIVNYLAEEKSSRASSFGLDSAQWQLLRESYDACDDCHSVSYEASRYRDGGDEVLRAMIARMGEKLAEPYSEEELEVRIRGYRALISDPERFDHLFPHDRPEPSEKTP